MVASAQKPDIPVGSRVSLLDKVIDQVVALDAEDSIYCPKCGDVLRESKNGSLECPDGQLTFAEELAERLKECYFYLARNPREASFSGHPIGGKWFCPGCGVPAAELTPGDLRCPVCHRSLGEFIHSLIERHPHFDGAGGYK